MSWAQSKVASGERATNDHALGGQTYDEGVPLCGVNRGKVDVQGLGVLPIGFDDGERMVVDREVEGREAGYADHTETVAKELLGVNDVSLWGCLKDGLTVCRVRR